MKKFTLLILAALFAAVSWSQETITFGTGTSYSYSILGGWYYHERHAVLYTSSELEGVSQDILSSKILKIAINLQTAPTAATTDRSIKIYVKEVTQTTLATSMFTDWSALLATATLVYTKTGTSISLDSGWNEFSFIAPYSYNGGNLMIITECMGNTATGGANTQAYYTNATGMHWRAVRDNNLISNSNSDATTNEVNDQRPNIRITFEPNSTCPSPNALAAVAGSITVSGAQISWNERGTATSWVLEYKKASETTWSAPVTVTVTPQHTLNGLDANTVYDVRVKSICGAEESNWRTGNFRTACAAFSIPFSENFSTWGTGSGVFDNPCWKKYTGTNAYTPATYPYISTSNNTSLYLYNSNTTVCAAFMPELNANGLDLAVEFDLLMAAAGRVNLVVGTDPQNPSTWIEVGDTIKDGNGNYKRYVRYLNYQAGTFIGFKSHTGNLVSVYVDNILVREIGREPNILTFNFPSHQQASPAVINNATHTVNVQVGSSISLTSLTPTITIPPYATIIPASGVVRNFTSPVTYTVFAEDGTMQTWTVTVTNAPISSAKNILTFSIPNQVGSSVINETAMPNPTITVSMPWNWTNFNALVPTFTVSPFATVSPLSGVVQNFTTPVTYTVTAEDGSTKDYTVTVNNAPMPLCTVPYSQNFSAPNAIDDIALFSQNTTDRFIIGSATGNPAPALYISSDGTANTYSQHSAYATAEFVIDFGNYGEYNLSFDWKCGGEGTTNDHGRVYIMNLTENITSNTLPNGFLGNFAGQGTTWQRFETMLDGTYKNTTKKLVFVWRTDASTINSNPLAIDNISITGTNCSRPAAVGVNNTTPFSTNVVWTETGSATEWIVEYKKTSATTWTTLSPNPTINPTAALSGLDENTPYDVRVKAVCGVSEESASVAYSFKTPCVAYSVPFTENFTSWTTGSSYFDPCWTKYTGTGWYGSSYPYVSSSYGQSLNFYQSSTTINAAFLPQLNAVGQTLQLEFDLQMAATNRMDVIIATDPQNQATWTRIGNTIDDGIGTGASSYKHYEFIIPNYQAGTYIGFKSHTGSLTSAYLDNITVNIAPSCPKPYISVSPLSNSATVTVTENGSATQWQYLYSTTSTMPDASGAVDVNTNPFTIGSLNPNTQYYVWVRSNCGAGEYSVWTPARGFKTTCAPESLPFTENFSSWTTGESWFHPCWTRYALGYSNGLRPYVTGGELYFYHDASTVAACFLPMLNANNQSLLMEFDLRITATTETFNIVVATNPQVKTTWQVIETITYAQAPNINTHFEIIIPNYQSGTYIGFSLETGSSIAYLDNIYVDIAPACSKPTITSVLPATNSVTVTFIETGTATQWQYLISTTSTVPNASEAVDVSSNPFTIPGLNSNTQYYIWVRSDCGAGEYSGWTAVRNFRTTCAPYSLPFTENFSGWTASSSYFDPCWTKYRGTDANGDYPYVSTSLNQSLNYYNSTTSNVNAAFLPQLNAVGMNIAIEFDLAMSTSGRMEVITATDPQNKSTWTTLGTVINDGTGTSVTNYKPYKRTITNYPAGTYIGFKYSSTSTYTSAYIDNIVVYEIVDNDVAAMSITSSVGTEGSHLTSANFTVTVRNFGNNAQTNVPVKLEVDGTVLPTTQQIASIASGTTATVTFNGVDISTPVTHTFTIRAFTDLATDQIRTNDTVSMRLLNEIPDPCTDGIKIGYGTELQNYAPIHAYFNYNYNQTIYLKSEIEAMGGIAGFITNIAYKWDGSGSMNSNSNNWTVYIGHTTKNSFTGTSDYVAIGTLQQVFSGTVTLPTTAGWMNINLTTPFVWNGTSNIVVAVHENVSGNSGTPYPKWYSTTAANRMIYFYQDGSSINPTSPTATTSGVGTSFPNIRMNFCSTFNITVTTNAATNIDATTATLNKTVVPSGIRSGFKYRKVTETVWIDSINGVLTNLLPQTEYEFKAYAAFGTDTVWGSVLTFTTLKLPPVANFIYVTINNSLTVSFSDTSTGEPIAWSWNFGDTGTSTIQHPSHTYAGAGSYDVTLIVTNTRGDSEPVTKRVIVTAPQGLNDPLEGIITLHPNPAKHTAILEIEGLNTTAQVVITDLAGRGVATYNLGAAETELNIDVSKFADGTYLLRIITEKGNSIQKLVVKK